MQKRKKRQYPMQSPRASNRLRTRRRQLRIKWQVDAPGMSSSEPQSVNPQRYGRSCWHCLIIVWWSTTSFRSHSNQNFCLASPKFPWFLAAAGPRYSQCAGCMEPSCMNMAGPATGGCQGVAQPDCRGSRRNSAKRSYLPWISTNGSLQLRKI